MSWFRQSSFFTISDLSKIPTSCRPKMYCWTGSTIYFVSQLTRSHLMFSSITHAFNIQLQSVSRNNKKNTEARSGHLFLGSCNPSFQETLKCHLGAKIMNDSVIIVFWKMGQLFSEIEHVNIKAAEQGWHFWEIKVGWVGNIRKEVSKLLCMLNDKNVDSQS